MRGIFGLSVVVLFAFSLSADDRHLDPKAAAVKYRVSIMRGMNAYMSALSEIEKGDVSYKKHVSTLASGLHGLAGLIPDAFPQGTGPDAVKTGAKPDVWQQWDHFLANAKQLEQRTAALESAAKKGDNAAIMKSLQDVGASCNGCHDAFRVKDQK